MVFGPNFCSPVHQTFAPQCTVTFAPQCAVTFAPQCTVTPLATANIRCIEDEFSFTNYAMKFTENGENIYHAIQ